MANLFTLPDPNNPYLQTQNQDPNVFLTQVAPQALQPQAPAPQGFAGFMSDPQNMASIAPAVADRTSIIPQNKATSVFDASSKWFAPTSDAQSMPPVSPVPPQLQQKTDADTAKLQQLQANGAGLNQIHNGFLRGLARVGDIAGTILTPGIAAQVPGTTLHNRLLQNQQRGIVAQDQANDQIAQNNYNQGIENQVRQAQLANEKPVLITPEIANSLGVPGLAGQTINQRDLGTMATQIQQHLTQPKTIQDVYAEAVTDAVRRGVDPSTDPKVQQVQDAITSIQKQTQPKNGVVVDRRVNGVERNILVDPVTGKDIADLGEKGEKPVQTPGVTVLVPNADGSSTVQKVAPGQTVAPGAMTTAGFNAQQTADRKETDSQKAGNDALTYGQNYLASGKFTGPGDEALMEKYFELAKPSSGFRMSEPQLKMLKESQSYMNSMIGKAHNLAYGTYFSPVQRQQIVDTMNNLAVAKGSSGATQSAQQSKKATMRFNPATGMLEPIK